MLHFENAARAPASLCTLCVPHCTSSNMKRSKRISKLVHSFRQLHGAHVDVQSTFFSHAEQGMLNRLKFTMQAEEDEDDLEHLKCGICLGLCDRPVTAPCQHNFCLKCFRKWVNQDKKQCPSCRAELTRALITNPRINTMLTGRIRQAQKVRVSPPPWDVAQQAPPRDGTQLRRHISSLRRMFRTAISDQSRACLLLARGILATFHVALASACF